MRSGRVAQKSNKRPHNIHTDVRFRVANEHLQTCQVVVRLIEVKQAFLQVITSVSNWAPNMSIGPPLAKDGLCFSSQALKQYGDITFMVFI